MFIGAILGKKTQKKHTSKHSRKSKKHQRVLSKKELETNREDVTQNRYFILGSWADHDARVVLITPTQITYFEKHNSTFYSINKTKTKNEYYPPLHEQLKDGEWRHNTYNYEKLFMLNSNDTWYSEKEYMKPVDLNKAYKSSGIMYDSLIKSYEIYYILIKLDAKRYVSLGYKPFEFEIPEDDEIINLTCHNSKSGNQNILLFGRKNTYTIDDGSNDFSGHYYIPNDFIKQYKYFDLWKDEKGPYIKVSSKDYKKILGIKVPHWKEQNIYNVIHYLETKDIELNSG